MSLGFIGIFNIVEFLVFSCLFVIISGNGGFMVVRKRKVINSLYICVKKYV